MNVRLQPSKALINELKRVLENAGAPHQLDNHAWVESLIVRERVSSDPALARRSPGHRLLKALSGLFCETRPGAPPRRGKRLDTNWGQFGLLAAMYFAPFELGLVRPGSLRDAWSRIDQVIRIFVFGDHGENLPEDELSRYLVIGDDVETLPSSTISDWHMQGLSRLAELLLRREEYLSARWGQASVVLDSARSEPRAAGASFGPNGGPTARPAVGNTAVPARPPVTGRERVADWLAGLIRSRRLWVAVAAIAALLLCLKAGRIVWLAESARRDVSQLQSVATGPPDLETIASAGPILAASRRDLLALRAEVGPFLWLGPLFGWVPIYGADLAGSRPLLDLASGLAVAADESYQGFMPLQAAQAESASPSPQETLTLLEEAKPRFEMAQASLEAAVAARAQIDAERLSSPARALVDKADQYLPLLQDGVGMALAAPGLLGADGPRTYLVLVQNEDELRATGGFISAVGTVTVAGGEVLSLRMEDSYAVDDLNKPYPYAPDPLRRYMAAQMWLLRDVNWSPNFPSTALMAEALYTYARPGTIDGVIAFDQDTVRLLLEATGPLTLENPSGVVSADNVVEYMRAAWSPSPGQGVTQEWWQGRKDFIGQMAAAMLEKVKDDPSLSWTALGRSVLRALDQRHILIQLDDPMASAVLARRGWDGAVRPGAGDYLMVINSNIGFNKVNAVVETSLDYSVDLAALASPTATLVVTHRNPASEKTVECRHAPDYGSGQYSDLIARCYWNYQRVYVPEADRLVEATPHAVPAEWMLMGESVPARVDTLEQIDGVQGFGTLLVVPTGESVETRFHFALSPHVVTAQGGVVTYELQIQKQAGTRAIPVAVRVRLPDGAEVINSIPVGQTQAGVWAADLALREDIAVELTFRLRASR